MLKSAGLAALALVAMSLADVATAQSDFPDRDAVRAELAETLGLEFVAEIPASSDLGLLAVDFQRSFTDPDEALYVPGSESDVATVDTFVRKNLGRITNAWYTMDTHPRYYVGSELYLVDAEGKPAPMFVDIDPNDILSGAYRASNPAHQGNAESYARCLLDKGLAWNVWPDHGEQGTEGWTLHPTIEALFDDYTAHWAPLTERAPDPMMVLKATNPHTEAFGAVEALCPNTDPETHRQDLWLKELKDFTDAGGVIVAFGEAINFCVSGTLIPLAEAGIPAEQIVLAYDASSPIPIFADRTRAALTRARELGIRFALLDDLEVKGAWRETSRGQPLLNYALPAPSGQ